MADPKVQALAAAPSRKELRADALKAAVDAVELIDGDAEVSDEELGQTVESALRAMVAAYSSKAKAPGTPRVTLEKAAPETVAAYFASTGLTRKQLAAAAGVSTSVIATVQNENGDRWSQVTFEAKQVLIAAWMKEHGAEIEAERQAAVAEAAAKAKAAEDKAARIAARAAAPKPAAKAKPAAKPAAKAKSTAKKPGRPSAAARQANRKQPAAVAATA